MLLVQSDFDYIHVNTLASYDFCDVLVYCLKYEQLTFHWFSHRWIKYFWNDMGNIYIRLDSNTTRYTRHKLHLLTLTIHLYLNYSHHNFICDTFKSCVMRSWGTRTIKKYIAKKNSYHNYLQIPLLVASVMDSKWVSVCGFKTIHWVHRVWCRNCKTLIMRRLLF